MPATSATLSFSPKVRIANVLHRLRRQRDDGVADRHDRRGRRSDDAGDQFGRPRARPRPRAARPARRARRRPRPPRSAAPGRGRRHAARRWSRPAFAASRRSGFIAAHSRRRVVPTCGPVCQAGGVPTSPAARRSRTRRAPPPAVCRRPCGSPSIAMGVLAAAAARQRRAALVRLRRHGRPDRRASGRHHRGRRRAGSCCSSLIPYLVLGLILALAAWFLPRRQPWARWIGARRQRPCSRC